MRIAFFLFAACCFSVAAASAQDTPAASAADAAYLQTATTRAQKIAASLSITDSAKYYAIQQAIAAQYVALSHLHAERDAALKSIKATTGSKEVIEAKTKAAEDESASRVATLQQQYVKQLSALLTDVQVVKVKDGMTYNVLPITYTAYLDMIPSLKADEKAQIMTWLTEAREYAMSGESSDKKHWWFGKYKGRINNYLAARGYDLQKERAAWEQRRKESEAAKKSTQ